METRVEKYKEYRNSFIKEGSISVDSNFGEPKTEAVNLDKVMKVVSENENERRIKNKAKRKKILVVSAFAFAAIAIIVGIILFAVYAWR